MFRRSICLTPSGRELYRQAWHPSGPVIELVDLELVESRAPSSSMSYRDNALSARFVVKAYLPSAVTAAQQISLRPVREKANP
jgi:hypothetical protein